jgi:hypothetical protein
MSWFVLTILVAVIGWLTMKLTSPSTSVDAACSRPELASLSASTTHMDSSPACFYSRTYHEARLRFLQQVRKSGLPFEQHALPIGFSGLFVDVALLRRRSDSLLIHISGTHGTEGFVGSAIQTALLSHVNESDGLPFKAINGDTAPSILFVHALNPFGMATFRRWNEDGIDLNRNMLLTKAQWDEVLSRDESEYDAINEVVNPTEPPTFLSLMTRVPQMAFRFLTAFVETKRALVGATYRKAGAIFFGGQRLSTSHQVLSEFLVSSGLTESAKRVTLIDVHSGLGPMGQDTLMFNDDATRACKVFTGAFACEFPGGNFTADSASSGYERTVGTVTEPKGYISLFKNVKQPGHAITFAQEFGTVPPLQVILALIRENQAFRFGDEATRRQFAQLIYDTFVPLTREARAHTVRRGVTLVQQALNDLQSEL